jgi:subtilisin family serine protease
MKKYFLLLLVVCCVAVFTVQVSNGQTNITTNEPVRVDPRSQQMDYEPGQVLVKFKDETIINSSKEQGFAKTGVTTVDAVLNKYDVKKIEKLFPNSERLSDKKIFQSFSGELFEQPNLHNIYKIELGRSTVMFEVIEDLKSDPNVVYAEPNYILSIIDVNPVSEILSENDIDIFSPNDPLFLQQWYIPAINADMVWDSTTGDTTQIISILDTGVDWLHPDLAANIWINYQEQNGIAGVDDDGNGYVDDIRGWDFINSDNDPRDDNSHGTHVAGIAAAKGNNNLGIAGVNWHAKIMPIKVFQSSGRGDVSTIAQGILYAVNKGATVLNMSFGTYARSLTMESALAYAYGQAVLVAAAGNDSKCIGPPIGACMPFYPAALSYVLGVQATEFGGGLADFSNADPDGPVFSRYPDLLNYEILSPGAGLISTIPNGGYRVMSGTSMAAPVVSGAVSLYRSVFPLRTQGQMWGDFINTSGNTINIDAAMAVHGEPRLWFVSNTIVDTLDGDNDGRVDAGETIELWFTAKNTWANAESVFVGIRFGEFEDSSNAQILKGSTFIGSISSYASRTNELSALRIRINPSVVNNRDLTFESLLWCKNSSDTVKQTVVLTVENGWELAGVMDSTLVLTPDKLWLVNSSFRVGRNGNLILRPGTRLVNNNGIVNRGNITGIGIPDSMIIIEGPGGIRDIDWNGNLHFEYTSFRALRYNLMSISSYFSHCEFIDYAPTSPEVLFQTWQNLDLKDCSIRDSRAGVIFYPASINKNVERNTFDHSDLTSGLAGQWGIAMNQFGNFKHNNFSGIGLFSTMYGGAALLICTGDLSPHQTKNNFIGFTPNNIAIATTFTNEMVRIPNQYWGTTDSAKIGRNSIADFWDDPNVALAQYWPYLTQPSDSTHGIVWKVLVNGKDAQDQIVDPLGVGPQRFDVYFNRPMDTTYTPELSFGVREPFTQNYVRDSARWSPDRRIWTSYYIVRLYTGDGINRIRVSGARDPEGFEIPVENMRFNFIVNAAGFASSGFTASAGLGKITLDWETPEVPDILGYNMYRFMNKTDTTFTTPVLINLSLITDTAFTDFNVVPNERYYYYYRVVRTNLSETDSSKIVGSVPYTAAKGDANGDLSVNVLDIVSMVSYILGQNPQPFILEAAEINNDSIINVLDVIGAVNIILGGNNTSITTSMGKARIELVENCLELTTDVPIAGIQFKLNGTGINTLQFIPSGILEKFEVANGMLEDSVRTYIMFSLNGNTLPVGKHILGTFEGMNSAIHLIQAILSNANGENVVTSVFENGIPLIPNEYYLSQNYPNPFNPTTTIQFGVPERADVKITFYNILGQQVKTFAFSNLDAGRHQIVWDCSNDAGNKVAGSVYFYRMHTQKYTQVKKLLILK